MPIRRTALRLRCGKAYYTLRRYLLWAFGGIRFARRCGSGKLPYVCFSHATPLLRRLKGADMRLQRNKAVNLKLAVARLDGLLLRPGETFSYWRRIGKPSRRKGYLDGMVLFCGRVGHGVGGGLCQLSNLIFWMTLHTALTVTERYRHSYDVFPDENRTQPFGSGATCVYNYRDLMVRNDTPATFQLCLRVTDTALEGEWRCTSKPLYTYRVYEKDPCISREYWGGYVRSNRLCRTVYGPDGAPLRDETLCENHALMMYAPFLESGSRDSACRSEQERKARIISKG